MRGFVEILEVLQRAASGQRFHAADARGKRAIGDDLEHADVAGAVDVTAAAKLARPVACGNDAHVIAVLLAKHRHRAALLRLGDRHDRLGHFDVLANLLVDQIFDLLDLLLSQRLVIGVIESQPVGSDQRSRLLDRFAENIFQRFVKKMRGGVIRSRIQARRDRDGCADARAMREMPFINANA